MATTAVAQDTISLTVPLRSPRPGKFGEIFKKSYEIALEEFNAKAASTTRNCP
jgi:hypothetical protein